MIKAILGMLQVLILGCGSSHIYHTYYGDIDIDTMEVAFTRYGSDWYLVRSVDKDSFNWDGVWKYIESPIEDYFCPDSNLYEESFPDNQGRIMVMRIDPYHQYDWLKK